MVTGFITIRLPIRWPSANKSIFTIIVIPTAGLLYILGSFAKTRTGITDIPTRTLSTWIVTPWPADALIRIQRIADILTPAIRTIITLFQAPPLCRIRRHLNTDAINILFPIIRTVIKTGAVLRTITTYKPCPLRLLYAELP
jgi:hypothetical protein